MCLVAVIRHGGENIMVWGYFAGIRRDDLLRVCNWKNAKGKIFGHLGK